jgi:hypothetical protein
MIRFMSCLNSLSLKELNSEDRPLLLEKVITMSSTCAGFSNPCRILCKTSITGRREMIRVWNGRRKGEEVSRKRGGEEEGEIKEEEKEEGRRKRKRMDTFFYCDNSLICRGFEGRKYGFRGSLLKWTNSDLKMSHFKKKEKEKEKNLIDRLKRRRRRRAHD